MTFADVCGRLGITKVCAGGCGLSANRHRTGTLFLDVIHWSERRMTKRALRRFLLLVAKRDRLNDADYVNLPIWNWYYLWLDNVEAGRLAAKIGVRIPADLSRNDRLACLTLARKWGASLSTGWPQVYSWAKRGLG